MLLPETFEFAKGFHLSENFYKIFLGAAHEQDDHGKEMQKRLDMQFPPPRKTTGSYTVQKNKSISSLVLV